MSVKIKTLSKCLNEREEKVEEEKNTLRLKVIKTEIAILLIYNLILPPSQK
jgi:hypothetical protein